MKNFNANPNSNTSSYYNQTNSYINPSDITQYNNTASYGNPMSYGNSLSTGNIMPAEAMQQYYGMPGNRYQELQAVNTAFFIENKLSGLREEMKKLQNNKPKCPQHPKKPQLKASKYTPIPYPGIQVPDFGMKPWYKRALRSFMLAIIVFIVSLVIGVTIPLISQIAYIGGGLSGLLLWFAIISVIIGFFKIDDRDTVYIEGVRNTPEYKQQCAWVDYQNSINKANADAEAQNQYFYAMQVYENQTLPQYNNELANYNNVVLPPWKRQVNDLQEAIYTTESALAEAYSVNIIPGKFRNLDSLIFISAYMGTSQFSLGDTLQRFDHDIEQRMARENLELAKAQKEISKEILAQSHYSNYLQNQLISIETESNDLLRSNRNWQRANTLINAFDVAVYRNSNMRRR